LDVWRLSHGAGLTFEWSRTHTSSIAGLHPALYGDLEGTLERARVPAYVIDRTGTIRWVNQAAQRVVGDVRGRHLTSVLAPEERRRGHEIFMRNLLGPREGSDNRGVLLNAAGERIDAELSAIPLESGGHVIGVFGQIVDVEQAEALAPLPDLTPRQHEVLRLLEHGRSTAQIASDLHISIDTVRNHIRSILRALGVHSRLEAVAVARHGARATTG
jgi:PAS domain S-box-containing protein